jgi:hypothetical protein
MTSRVPLLMVIAVGLLFSIACGGGKVGGTNPTGPFTIGGSVTGLTGTGLVLQDNGGDDLTVSASGTFTFATTIAANGAYSVTVLTQPTNPTQTCTVANGSGTAAANVTNVAVTCTTATTTFNISGTLTGLSAGSSVVLQDNGTDNLTLTADGAFTFATKVTNYSVTVLTQPVNQACTVTNAAGTATADITNVQVLCAAPVMIGGTLTGLTTGGTVVLANNGTFDTLSLDTDGQFTFPRQLAAGSAYDVTVSTQPTGQTCTVTNASGTATTDVTNVTVTCGAQLFTIGGTITGLSGTVVLQDNGGDNLTLTADGTFTFSTGLALGSPYNVTVFTQPAGQSCAVTFGSGTVNADVTTVQVTCAGLSSLTLGVSATGLTGTLTVQDDTGAQLALTAASPTQNFSNLYSAGATYSVSIVTQPAGQTCSLGPNSSGVILANTVVTATCAAAGNTFTIGGILYDLSANPSSSGVILQDNAADDLTLHLNGTFTFATALASGSAYDVTVSMEPTTPDQSCTVLNGTGTATANVTNVQVVCISEWTWISGANTVAQVGTYPATRGNAGTPGAREGAGAWIDASGNKWIFGGFGYDNQVNGTKSVLNDLWKFTGSQWIWAAGSNQNGQAGVYPTTIGQPGTPGARAYPITWKDSAGNFWMFGGYGVDVNGLQAGPMNDLWEYNGQWLWQGGSTTQGASGVYTGTPFPGARFWSSQYQDASGNLWMFGGNGVDSNGTTDFLNDLWEFNGTQWTFLSGSTTVDQTASYGTLGTGAPGNHPGARNGSSSWVDSAGTFWLFGGDGFVATGFPGELNDLWTFTGGQWTWVGGSNAIGTPGTYGTQGIPDPANVPGGRLWATTWLTPNGDVWLLGGQRLGGAQYSDFWKYSQGQWSWMDGSQTADQLGVYGVLGTPDPANIPGARQLGAPFVDSTGNVWLFGGFGQATQPTKFDAINDLWEFQP